MIGMSHTHTIAASLVLVSTGFAQIPSEAKSERASELPRLAEPFLVEADGAPIDSETGHAAPFVTDFDGDGLWDLAVGQFGGGTCRLYKNLGTATEPRFEGFTLLQTEGKPAAMESS